MQQILQVKLYKHKLTQTHRFKNNKTISNLEKLFLLKRRDKMERKGQGAIEYLLIIGAAILVVAVVVIALTSVTSAGGDAVDNNNVAQSNDALQCQQLCNQSGGTIDDDGKCTETITGIPDDGTNCDAYQPE
jgi:hypothetical protein